MKITWHLNWNWRDLFAGQVAWIRHSDLNLLTVGNGTYTKDARFAASVPTSGDSWSLQIRNVQLKDQGVYECQIGITPHISHFIHLSVVGEFSAQWTERLKLAS